MPFLKSYFDTNQLTLLVLAIFFFVLSIIAQLKAKPKYAFILLGVAAFFVYSFSASLDAFLNLWDERFHALVAQNLTNHILLPTLYDDPIVNMAYDTWDKQHVWLHKQPLFLWQMALSFKLFGVSEFTMRLPSVLLGTILVLITYRCGQLLVNQQVGFISGVITLTTLHIIGLISGRQPIEHNDISFFVYVSLSIWVFIEYYYNPKKQWIYLIGLFSGMAILCKWLVGLLVYWGWGILRITQKKIGLTENKDIFVALLTTIVVALPWQLFILLNYTTEAINEYQYSAQHFTIPIEGHGGSFWYYFKNFDAIHGIGTSIMVIPAFVVWYKKNNNVKLLHALWSIVFVTYLFFSLAATKMPSFTIIVAMPIFIALATLFSWLIDFINQFAKTVVLKNIVFCLGIIVIVLIRFDIEHLQEKHTLWKDNNHYTRMLRHNKQVFQALNLPPKTVLFNVNGHHYIEAMFYTKMPAYSFMPTLEQYQDVKNKGRNIAIFKQNQNQIPDYLAKDTSVLWINQTLMIYD